MRTRQAITARQDRAADADYELYEMICDHPGEGIYGLAKFMGWSIGRTRAAITRLDKKGYFIKISRVERNGRIVLSVMPKPWQEMSTPEELEEFRKMDF